MASVTTALVWGVSSPGLIQIIDHDVSLHKEGQEPLIFEHSHHHSRPIGASMAGPVLPQVLPHMQLATSRETMFTYGESRVADYSYG